MGSALQGLVRHTFGPTWQVPSGSLASCPLNSDPFLSGPGARGLPRPPRRPPLLTPRPPRLLLEAGSANRHIPVFGNSWLSLIKPHSARFHLVRN